MPVNKDCVGKEYAPITSQAKLEAIQQYARACNDDNRAYFDSSRAGGIVAPPMYNVVVTWPSLMGVMGDPELAVDLVRVLHGEQDMEFLAPIRPGDQITSAARVVSIETKSNGEVVIVELNVKNQRGEQAARLRFGAFIRGGGKGGAPAEAKPPEAPDRGEPVATVAQTIDKDQTYRYKEASGDLNPIHVDENFAKMAGLPGIIVHGLCTMAFTSRVMVDKLCGGDPLRLKRLCVRFSRPVFPGETITTKVWYEGERDGRKVYAYETYNPAGQAVIRGGIAEVAC
jgi:acyl dehydratase